MEGGGRPERRGALETRPGPPGPGPCVWRCRLCTMGLEGRGRRNSSGSAYAEGIVPVLLFGSPGHSCFARDGLASRAAHASKAVEGSRGQPSDARGGNCRSAANNMAQPTDHRRHGCRQALLAEDRQAANGEARRKLKSQGGNGATHGKLQCFVLSPRRSVREPATSARSAPSYADARSGF